MKRAGVIGLGDMGSGLALNLIKNGFETWGFDLSGARMAAFKDMGGRAASGAADAGRNADAVYVMVMNGAQAEAVILGEDGLVKNMAPGGVVILTATIKPSEARAIGEAMEGSGVHLIDSPVSGGFPGAQSGALTMMAAAPGAVLDEFAPVMDAVSKTIHRVGAEPGEGQVMKSCLQSYIGAVFGAVFESAALAAKAGVSGENFYKVVTTSSAGCAAADTALGNILDGKFKGTGSGIGTMHKDLTISLNMAEELGVPMHLAAAAMQLFHAGKSKYPDGDNWIIARVIEETIGAELRR